MATANLGTGISVTHTNLPETDVYNVEFPSLEKTEVEVSHYGSVGYKEYIPTDLQDPGECTVTCAMDPSSIPTIGGASSLLVINWPDRSTKGGTDGATWSIQAFIKGLTVDAPLEDKTSYAITFKLTGPIIVS